MTTRARTLELLHVPECPGVQPFLDALEQAVDDPVETIEIRTEAEAGARGMAGSPTLLVDGRDIFAAQGTGAGLSCRLYRDLDDRLVRAPSAAQISRVLTRIPSQGTWGSDDGIVHVTARYGYMESPDVPDVLRQARELSPELSVAPEEETSYFVSRIELRVGDEPGMATWRTQLFVATSGIAPDAADCFNLPRERTVLVGSVVEV